MDQLFLWKCPLRCHVPRFNLMITPDGEVGSYIIFVTTKNGTQWEVERTYEDFLSLRTSLPNSICMRFKCRFPMPRPYSRKYMLSDEFLQYRRARLETWMCELLLVDTNWESGSIIGGLEPFLDLRLNGFFDVCTKETSRIREPDGVSGFGTFRKRSLHLKSWRARNFIIWSHGHLTDYDPKDSKLKNSMEIKQVIMTQGNAVNAVKALGRCSPWDMQQAISIKLRSLTDSRTLDVVFDNANSATSFARQILGVCHNKADSGIEGLITRLQNPNMALSADMPRPLSWRPSGPACVPLSIKPPTLNIVILVVGTRGDVQPFVYFGQALQRYGHRVRLATHVDYRADVTTKGGLEFYPLGGDPVKLSSYMVQSEGRLLPYSSEEFAVVPEKMQMCREICFSTGPACTMPDPEDPDQRPFTADAIISNPVSYGHIHVAEALSIPLHIFFPQPWYPTTCFPHPLSNMKYDTINTPKNYMSFLAVEKLMHVSLAPVFNEFRRDVLHIPRLRPGEGGSALLRSNKVPISHMWSPTFVPKCPDWPDHVDVVGEMRLMEGSIPSYSPDPLLVAFLEEAAGQCIYIGFGSMVIADKQRLVDLVVAAAGETGCHVLMQSGWTKYADEYERVGPNVMVIGAMPHDWLFRQVSGVIHHGGAGTTSAGLRQGLPTFICPFFGDQHMWAEMVFRSGVGPAGCPIVSLTKDLLVEAFRLMIDPATVAKARELGAKMSEEDGVARGVESFHKRLPLISMICEVSIFDGRSSRLAKHFCRKCGLKMCDEVDEILHRPGSGRENHRRRPFRASQWGVLTPTSALDGLKQGAGYLLYETVGGVYDFFRQPVKGAREGGVTGAVLGVGKGIVKTIWRPIYGGAVLCSKIYSGASSSSASPARDLQIEKQLNRSRDDERPSAMDRLSLMVGRVRRGSHPEEPLATLDTSVADSEESAALPEGGSCDSTVEGGELHAISEPPLICGTVVVDSGVRSVADVGDRGCVRIDGAECDVQDSHIDAVEWRGSGAGSAGTSTVAINSSGGEVSSTTGKRDSNRDTTGDDTSCDGAACGYDADTHEEIHYDIVQVLVFEKALQKASQLLSAWVKLDDSGERSVGWLALQEVLPREEAEYLLGKFSNANGRLTFAELAWNMAGEEDEELLDFRERIEASVKWTERSEDGSDDDDDEVDDDNDREVEDYEEVREEGEGEGEGDDNGYGEKEGSLDYADRRPVFPSATSLVPGQQPRPLSQLVLSQQPRPLSQLCENERLLES